MRSGRSTQRLAGLLVLAAGWLTLNGCSAVKIVEVSSTPAQATIYVDGLEIGETPRKVKLDFSSDPSRRVILQIVAKFRKPAFQGYYFDEVPEKVEFRLDEE